MWASPVAPASAVGDCARPRHAAWRCAAASATAAALPRGAGARVGDCCSGRGGSRAGRVREDECGGDGRGGKAGARDPEAEGGRRGGGGDGEEQEGLRRVRDNQGRRALHAVVDSGCRRPRQVCTPTYPGALILVLHHYCVASFAGFWRLLLEWRS
jgi:hypothetical protein